MGKFVIYSYPKINLALDILGRDARAGYHKIRTVFHELRGPLFDEIEISATESGVFEVQCDDPRVPMDEKNTVLQAAELFFVIASPVMTGRSNLASGETGARIFIKKRIPVMSGLGGGSSNAAATLKGLAEFGSICHCENCRAGARQPSFSRPAKRRGVKPHQSLPGQTLGGIHSRECMLFKLAKKIGMDVPFFINGGTALGEHFGEKITPLPSLPPELKFEIIETAVEISTREAYANIDLEKCGKNTGKTQKLIAAIRAGDPHGILKNLHNDFEEFIFPRHPKLLHIKKQREKTGAKVLLCGSGGALVIIHSSASP